MKKRFMRTLTAALLLSTLFCIAAYAGEWEKQSQGWVYWMDDGNVATNSWITGEDGSAYYVGSNGVMQTNTWIQSGDKWYYLDNNGNIVKGAMLGLNNNKTWYLLGDDGAMQVNTWYQDPESGEWYYFGSNGEAYKSGWFTIDGDEYYFLNSSKMAHDATINGVAHVGSDGRRTK